MAYHRAYGYTDATFHVVFDFQLLKKVFFINFYSHPGIVPVQTTIRVDCNVSTSCTLKSREAQIYIDMHKTPVHIAILLAGHSISSPHNRLCDQLYRIIIPNDSTAVGCHMDKDHISPTKYRL